MARPFISIGIIFKNEIRCLERCVKSLQRLRKAIPCELIMADTGSTDGSREIAQEHADIFFDFPWIDDFSAARNALMDRASGRWFMTMDADEWLDADIKELVSAIRSKDFKDTETFSLIIRNYSSYDRADDAVHSDFTAVRILRMSTGIRYQGAIHESWMLSDRLITTTVLSRTVLHHDGYVGLNDDRGREKRARNMALLRKKLEYDPDSLLTLLQCIESSQPDPDNMDYVYRAVEVVKDKKDMWEQLGPPIMRYAVFNAVNRNLPELDEWVQLMEDWYPKSTFTNIDVGYIRFGLKWMDGDAAGAVECGDRCLNAMVDHRTGRGDRSGELYSTLTYGAPRWEQSLRLPLASAHFQNGDPEGAYKILEKLIFSMMNEEQVRNCVRALRELQIGSEVDLSRLVSKFYREISKPSPSEDAAKERRQAFSDEALRFFTWEYLDQERTENRIREAYTLFIPLASQCIPGTAAALMAAKKPAEMNRLLKNVEDVKQLPVPAVYSALAAGARVPLPATLEEMDTLAEIMVRPNDVALLEGAAACMEEGLQQLVWARGVAIVSVLACKWDDEASGMALVKGFVRVESAYLTRCYTPDLLSEENTWILPPLHRFGYFCTKAFEALDNGDAANYARLLKTGLKAYPGGKAMVDFLSLHTPELQAPTHTQELLDLAAKVRMLLCSYPADDPAVAMLKQSPAYQKVAHLIEGPEPGVFGGLKQ